MAIRLWVRTDKMPDGKLEEPKALERDAVVAPGPGEIVDVDAPNPSEAKRVLKLARGREPDRKADKSGWIDWDDARERVTPRGTLAKNDKTGRWSLGGSA